MGGEQHYATVCLEMDHGLHRIVLGSRYNRPPGTLEKGPETEKLRRIPRNPPLFFSTPIPQGPGRLTRAGGKLLSGGQENCSLGARKTALCGLGRLLSVG